MKIYSPIKSGGGSVLGKPESQLSQIISIHPDKAKESGEKLLIADGKTYNAGDIQMSELRSVYDIVYQNTETGESVALTYNTVDMSTTNLERIGGLLVEDNNNDKFLLLLKTDRAVSATNFDNTKINVFKMASGQSTFTLFKTIDFGTTSWASALGKSFTQLSSNFFNFDPETGNLYTVRLDNNYQMLYFNKINDVNDTDGFSSTPITKDDSFGNVNYFQQINNSFCFNWNDKRKVLEGVVFERYNGSSNRRLITIEINPLAGQATKLGTLKRFYNSTVDKEYLSTSEVLVGRYFEDNSGKIFHTRIGANESSEDANYYIYGSFKGTGSSGYTNNYNPYHNQRFARSSSFQTSDMVLHMLVDNLYSHPETGETLLEPHYCLFEFDRNFNCKIIDFKPESYIDTIYNKQNSIFNAGIIRTSKEGVTTMSFTEEQATGLGYDFHITCFEYSNNNYRLIQILSNTGDTITDGVNTFNIANSRWELTHLTSEYYLIHYKTGSSNTRDYAIVKIPNSFTGGIIDSQDLEVIKVVNEPSGVLDFDRLPHLYYDNKSLNTLFTAEFRNFVNNGTGVDNTIDFVINSGVFGDKITVPDRTAYNDPNGLSKDYIIKSVKGIKGTTTGE